MIAKICGIIVGIVVTIVPLLAGYDIIRNEGKLFVCDMVELIGKKDLISNCTDIVRILELWEFLANNEGNLDESQRKKLEELKPYIVNLAFKNLSSAIDINSEPVDTQTKEATIEAITETIEEGNAEERRALALIANGNIDGGLELLINLASESAVDNMKQWRNIGRLSYSVDTTKALAAYKKVITFDQSRRLGCHLSGPSLPTYRFTS